MKKGLGFISIVLILAFMAALPIGSAFAKDPGTINLVIHNKTGAKVNFDLLDQKGIHHASILPPGQTIMVLDQGWYGYFASLPCGNQSGNFNLNVSKELYLSCGNGIGVDLYNFARRNHEPACWMPVFPSGPPLSSPNGIPTRVPCCPIEGNNILGPVNFLFVCIVIP